MTKINSFGLTHVGSKLFSSNELDEFSEGDEEIVFFERPVEDYSETALVKAFLMNPTLLVWKFSYRVILRLVSLLENLIFEKEISVQFDDAKLAERKAQELDAKLVNVDKNLVEMIESAGWVWTPLSWVIFLSMIVGLQDLIPRMILENYPGKIFLSVYTFAYVFITASFFVSLPLIIQGIEKRNIFMWENILDEVGDEEYDKVLLLTGKAHVDGFENLARFSGIEYRKTKLSSFRQEAWSRIRSAF